MDAAKPGQFDHQWQAALVTYDDRTRKIAKSLKANAERYGSSTQLQSALVRADETLEKLSGSLQSRLCVPCWALHRTARVCRQVE